MVPSRVLRIDAGRAPICGLSARPSVLRRSARSQILLLPGLASVVIGRDLIIVAGATTYNFLIGSVEPNPSGISKLNTGLQLLYMLLVISGQAFDWPLHIITLLVGSGVFFTSVVSGLDYVIRWSTKAIAASRA